MKRAPDRENTKSVYFFFPVSSAATVMTANETNWVFITLPLLAKIHLHEHHFMERSFAVYAGLCFATMLAW